MAVNLNYFLYLVQTWKDILLVGAGGFVGSAARYSISLLMSGIVSASHLPAATFTVNFLGSFLIGVLMAVLSSASPWHFLAVIGFCGGFTTFSTFSAELFNMIKTGSYPAATLYIALSIVVCISSVWIGIALGSRLIR